jgi:general secretion pathway protein G
MHGRKHGYTIIELLVVMAVLGVLAMAAMPLAELSARRSKERELKLALRELRQAIDAYKSAYDSGHIAKTANASGYPPSLHALVEGIPDARLDGQTLYFLRRVPADPFAVIATNPEKSWGLRSYSSPPQEPRPGEDVYDVHSLSEETGINGIPYREW